MLVASHLREEKSPVLGLKAEAAGSAPREIHIWHVACSGYSVINSLSAPGLYRKRALEVLPCCPIWYRNKWQMICCQLKLGNSPWFLRSPAQHQGTFLEIWHLG